MIELIKTENQHSKIRSVHKAIEEKLDILDLEYSHISCVAGGSILSLVNGQKMKDVDVFFISESQFDDAVVKSECRDLGTILRDDESVLSFLLGDTKFDFVKKIYGSPEEILSEFDFTVSCAAVSNNGFHHHKLFWQHLHFNKLALSGDTPFPSSTLRRMQKYIKRGFTMCIDDTMELASRIQNSSEEINIEGMYID